MRELLQTQGQLTHMALRVREVDDTETWKQTEEDLDRIAPPLTRLLNRYDATRAAAAAGDELSLAAGVSQYAVKNYMARRRLIRQVAAMPPEPVSGRAADPDTGPPPDASDAIPGGPPSLTPKGPHGR